MHAALTIAGSDSGGGAGVQADLAAMRARSVFPTSALTAVTAQNTRGVAASEAFSPETVADQIRAVAADVDLGAAKTGMLADEGVVRAVADALPELPLVVDPVVVAASGDRLLSEAGVEALRERLLPVATLVTPNRPEAELLTGTDIDTAEDAAAAGRELRAAGADAALVTGGHARGETVVDTLVTGSGVRTFEHPRYEGGGHGTGCTLSASIAAGLARGDPLEPAVADGVAHAVRALRFAPDIGEGASPVAADAPARVDAGVPEAVEAVETCARTFEANLFVSRVVPEVGMQVAVAPPCAVAPEDVVGVDGRLHETADGVRAAGGIRPGASSHVARFLLGVRETDPEVAAACNLRRTKRTVTAVEARVETVHVDRREEPESGKTMDWVATTVMAEREAAPGAVVDTGAEGKEAMVRLLAPDAETLRGRVLDVAGSLRSAE